MRAERGGDDDDDALSLMWLSTSYDCSSLRAHCVHHDHFVAQFTFVYTTETVVVFLPAPTGFAQSVECGSLHSMKGNFPPLVSLHFCCYLCPFLALFPSSSECTHPLHTHKDISKPSKAPPSPHIDMITSSPTTPNPTHTYTYPMPSVPLCSCRTVAPYASLPSRGL